MQYVENINIIIYFLKFIENNLFSLKNWTI